MRLSGLCWFARPHFPEIFGINLTTGNDGGEKSYKVIICLRHCLSSAVKVVVLFLTSLNQDNSVFQRK